MRLLSHNLLMCNVKNCTKNNYPLAIKVKETKLIDTEFDKEFLKSLIPKLDWTALYKTVVTLGNQNFPSEVTKEALEDEKFLIELHKILLRYHIIQGELICENCGRVYPIVNGIPNLILNDDEI